jgi:hypothetical protein
MSVHQQTSEHRVIPMQAQQPVGGAIIDARGREIPITEHMIQRACNELQKHWVAPASKRG